MCSKAPRNSYVTATNNSETVTPTVALLLSDQPAARALAHAIVARGIVVRGIVIQTRRRGREVGSAGYSVSWVMG